MSPPPPSPTLTALITSLPQPPSKELTALIAQDPRSYQSLANNAATHNHPALLSYCLTHGATINNALEIAAWKGASPELYAVMMEHGWPECNGLSVRQVLGTNYVKGARMVDFLIGRGAEVERGVVVAVALAARGDVGTLEVLANHNAPFRGRGALQAAAKSNDIPASAFLLAHGVDVDEVPAEDTWDPR